MERAVRSKRALRNIITNLAMQVAAIIYGFVVPKIIIDYFGSDVNGLVSSITQFLTYIALLDSGFGPVVRSILYKPIAKKDNKTIASILRTSEIFFRRIALLFMLYIAVLCVIFPIIAKKDFDAIFTISLVIIISISTFAEYFFGITYKIFLQAKQKLYIVSIVQIITYILSTVVVVVFALLGANILIIKFATGVIFILRPLVQNLYVKRKYNIVLSGVRSDYKIKQKWDGLAQHIAAVLHGSTDVVVLTVFTTLSEVSVYSVYTLVTSGVKRIIQSFSNGLDASFGDMIARDESEKLRNKFSIYELIYMIVNTIIFSVTIMLITAFVKLYTSGVTDVDYVRPLVGYLLVMGEFIWAVRSPYSTLILAAGHFKETRLGAWVEAGVNMILSVSLVFQFGIVGVAIGTITVMTIRTIEFVYHANKHILRRGFRDSVGKICIAFSVVIISTIATCLINFNIENYSKWIMSAIVAIVVTGALTVLLYYMFYKKEMKVLFKRMKRIGRIKKFFN